MWRVPEYEALTRLVWLRNRLGRLWGIGDTIPRELSSASPWKFDQTMALGLESSADNRSEDVELKSHHGTD